MRPLKIMTIGRSALAYLTCAVTLACGALVTNAGPAAAGAATLLQVQPRAASVVTGEPFAAYLKVEGTTRLVTYKQSAGAPNITVSAKGLINASAGLGVGSYKATGTDSDGAGVGVWTFTLTVIAHAPANFSATAARVYSSIYNFDQQKGSSSSLQTPAQYQAQMAKLTPDGAAAFYASVSAVPEWFQIPAIMESATATFGVSGASPSPTGPSTPRAGAVVPAPSRKTASTKAASTKAASTTSAQLPHAVAAAASAGNPVSVYVPDGTGNGYSDSACSSIEASDSIVFGLQIVVDASYAVYNLGAVAITGALAAGPPTSDVLAPPFILITALAAGVLLAAQVAHDTIAYLSLAPAGCRQNDLFGYAANIDNSSVQTYNLLTSAVSAIAGVQTSVAGTDQDVKGVASQLGAAQTSLTAAIAQNAHAIQLSVGSGSQGVLSQLQTDNAGLQQDLSMVDNDVLSVTDAVNNAYYYETQDIDNRASQIQSSLDGDFQTLTQTMTARFDQVDQHITALSQKVDDGHTEQIKLQIENALTSTGATAPVSMLTPGTQGGLLTPPNSWNTSVQDVVLASTTCSTGQADVAASNWKQAFKDFRTCYQSVATLP